MWFTDHVLRAFIFDCDGVLADNESAHYVAFSTAFMSRGMVLSRQSYDELSGLPDREVIIRALESAGKDGGAEDVDALLESKRTAYGRSLAAGVIAVPGVADFIRQASSRYSLAVASGAFADEVAAIVDGLGVADLIGAIVSVEDCENGKPDPEPFVRALERLNESTSADDAPIEPGECLVFEDSPHGLAAARAARMRTIGITTSHQGDALVDADLVAPHFRALDLQRVTAFFDRRAR
ncbi:MAG: HAD family hydrolase [Planctomycetota bacterium]